MVKKNLCRGIGCLVLVLAVFLSAACLQPANDVSSLEYVPQGLKAVSANFAVSAGSDMIVVSFEGGSFQNSVSVDDFRLRVVNGDAVPINAPVVDSETLAVLPFSDSLTPGNYNLIIEASAFSKTPGRITVKAIEGDGVWSTPLEATWFNRNPVYVLAYGSGKYLAGGGGGNLAYSRDGEAWTNIPPGSAVTQSKFTQDGEVKSIAYGNGMFYAVGKKGQVSYSTDGQSWTGYTEEMFKENDNYLSINAIIYGGGRFLAAGEKGGMWCLTDDGLWTWVADNRFGNDSVRALAYGRTTSGDRYVAGGDGDTDDTGKLCWSEDGVVWNYSESFGANNKRVNGLAFGGGYFVAVLNNGKIFRSADGASWSEEYAAAGGTGLLSVVYGSGTFIAAGHNGIALMSSDNGDTWNSVSVPFSTGDQIPCAVYSGGRFILAGSPYSGGNSRLTMAYVKPGIIPASESPEDITSEAFSLEAGENQLTITLTGGAFKERPQASDFDLSEAGFRPGTVERDRQNPAAVVFKGIAVTAPGGGKTITVKASALSAKAVSVTVTKQKVLAWTTVQDTKFGSSSIRGIAYGDGKYVAVGAGKIAASSNGVTWTEILSPSGDNRWAEDGNYVDFQGITYGNGKFIAVGYWLNGDNGNGWGVAAVSTDNGSTWTMKDKVLTNGNDSAHIYAIAWTGANFVAVGRWGRSATSTDGVAWTTRQINGFNWPDNQDWWEDAYAVAADGNGKVVAGGAKGKLAYSNDHGVNWSWAANNFFGPDKAVRTIAVRNNTFIAAGDDGNMKTAASSQVKEGTGGDGGDNWQGIDSKFGGTGILALASGGSKIIAAGHNGKMSESANGLEWTALEAGTGLGQTGFTGEEQIACIVCGGGKFIIGGNAYGDKGNASKIAYSNQQ